jgi:general secretion pathway protein H
MSRPNTTSACRGFTLLEVLVVLMIMGLLVGLVSAVTLPDDRARLGLESERLARLLALAREEARFSGRAVAWTAEPPGYRFWQHDSEDGWSEIRGRDLLLPRTLPRGMAVVGLRVENSPVTGPLRLEFSSDGAASAFTLELGLGKASSTIAGSPVGNIAVIDEEGGHDAIPAAH